MPGGMSVLTLLAEEQKAPQPRGFDAFFLFIAPLLLIMILFQFMFSPQRREKKHLENLLKTLKKNDRVVTVGGMIGTVAQISPEKSEVTLKVDDNTRIRMLLSSIRDVLTETKDAETETASKPAAGARTP